MAVPKERKSKMRTRTRRSHLALKPPLANSCPRCKTPKLPHRVCPNCGYYRGQKALILAEKKA